MKKGEREENKKRKGGKGEREWKEKGRGMKEG